MATPLMAGLESQGIASHGPMPAGMLRIRQGSQERYIWPVHLGGWLAMGWWVAGAEGSSVGVAAGGPPAPAAVLDPGPAAESPNEPAPTRGRRGRRRKDEPLPAATADAGISTVSDDSNGDSDAIGSEPSEPALDAEQPAAAITELEPDAAAEPSPESEPALTALPDDLFSDPLI